MTDTALAALRRPTVVISGRPYPIVLPSARDPRLHLAAVIVSLQILGQTAFHFRLSIAQILIALGTCAVLEIGIVFGQRRMIMWPASALRIALGYATCGEVGFEGRSDYAALGTVTNLAARLSDEATGGQILIAQRLYAEVEDDVEVESAGEYVLKGFPRPIAAFNVLSVGE